jgi:hypothetical protein
MNSDRKRKKAARAYKASHDGTYGDALRAVAISRGHGRRRRRATKALGVPASTLVEALARFLDRRPPATQDVLNLVEQALTKLEEVPSRKRPLQDDLTHALTMRTTIRSSRFRPLCPVFAARPGSSSRYWRMLTTPNLLLWQRTSAYRSAP